MKDERKVLVSAAVIVLVVLLAGAAFVGGQLLMGQGLSALRSSGDVIQPAKELPQTSPDVEGVFDHRQDNSFFVGTGQVRKMPQTDQSGNVST